MRLRRAASPVSRSLQAARQPPARRARHQRRAHRHRRRRRAAPAAKRRAPPETYAYDPAGRRDPFLNLLGSATDDKRSTLRKGDGPAGMTVGEISVRGVMQSRGKLVAMVQGPDNRTYIVHQGDKLARRRDEDDYAAGAGHPAGSQRSAVASQTAEVRKLLRSLEDAKE